MMTEQIMHMGVENPQEKRREILNLAINSVQLLKHFEDHKTIMAEKDIYKKRFIEAVKELHILFDDLKESLPKIKEEKRVEEKPKEEKKAEKKETRKIETKPEKTFERDIEELRRKIESI